MKFKAQIDGRERDVQASADGLVQVDGRSFACALEGSRLGRRLVKVEGETFEVTVVEAQEQDGVFLLELAGERIPVTVRSIAREETPGVAAGQAGAEARASDQAEELASRSPAQKPTVKAEDGLWAPVPGKVVSVLVNPGDMVKEGDPVLVLEAMKMENELHAPRGGRVTAVFVKPGDQVERGQLLVVLE